jgi:hypothetical protein
MWEQSTYGSIGAPSATLGASLAQHRFFRFANGTPGAAALCSTGLAADGVTHENQLQYDASNNLVASSPTSGYLAMRGLPVVVESGGAVAAGANVQSDSTGRAVTAAGGVVIGRALSATGGAGQTLWVCFA